MQRCPIAKIFFVQWYTKTTIWNVLVAGDRVMPQLMPAIEIKTAQNPDAAVIGARNGRHGRRW